MSCGNNAVEGGSFFSDNEKGIAASAFFVIAISIAYPLVMIFYSFVGGVVFQVVSSLAGATVFFVMLFRETRMEKENKAAILFVVFSLFFLGWYGALWTSMRSYGAILVFLSCLGIAWATLEFGLSRYVYEYPFFLFLGVTGVLISLGTDQYEFNQVLAVGSRNVYSAILMAFAMGYLFSRRIRGEKASIALGVALVVASFYLYSRTGLVLAFALFFLFLVGSGVFDRGRHLFLLFLPMLLSLLLWVFVSFDFGDFLARNSNFERGFDSPRFAIWDSYFQDIDLFALIFGYDMNGNDLIAEFGGNPHSAYLRLHAYFGVGLLFLMLFALLSWFELVRNGMWFFIFLSFCFFFRAIFDPVYFIWVFDYVFYPFIFFVFFEGYFRHGKPRRHLSYLVKGG